SRRQRGRGRRRVGETRARGYEGSGRSVRTACRLSGNVSRRRSLGCHTRWRPGLLAFLGSVPRKQSSGGRMGYVESRNRATSDPETRREVLAELEARGIDDVLLWFTDLEGHLKSFSITRSEVEDALGDGMGFDGSSITGFNAIEESDMVAIPDPETFRVLPD